jgi:pantothenate kinase type III
MENETMENTTKAQTVPAIRSDSVVAYLSNIAAVLTNMATDLNQQIANITASMNGPMVGPDTQSKETKND